MNQEDARALIAPFYDALTLPASKDVRALVEGIASPDWRSFSGEAVSKSREEFIQQVMGFGKLIPDLTWNVREVFVDGDRIIVRSEAGGTPAGEFMGVPHGGKRLPIFVDPLNWAMEEFSINNRERQAAFIAQLAHESGQFLYMEEIATGDAYNGRKDLGNLEPEAIAIAAANHTTAGRWWKGHGPIQITGYYNHKQCGEALLIDLLNSPKRITLPEQGCRSAAWFWNVHGLNKLADENRFREITKAINGGTNGAKERLAFYIKAREVLGCEA